MLHGKFLNSDGLTIRDLRETTNKRIGILAGDSALKSRVTPDVTKIVLKKKQILFHDEDFANSLFEVISGALKIVKVLPDGREQIVEVATDGWVCGLADGNQYNASCMALVPTMVFAYSKRVLACDPAKNFVRLETQIEKQMCALHNRVLDLGRKTAKEQVATFLMRFVSGRGVNNCLGPNVPTKAALIHVPLSQTDFGDYLGLANETVSRIISGFLADGLVVRKGGLRDLYIKNICRLCRLSQIGCNL